MPVGPSVRGTVLLVTSTWGYHQICTRLAQNGIGILLNCKYGIHRWTTNPRRRRESRCSRCTDRPTAPAILPCRASSLHPGNFSNGYRGRLWTFRQYSGFGTAEESNRRYRYLLDQGGTGLSVALDLPTQCGYDSDDPEYGEEVGRVGVAVDTLADAEVLSTASPGQDQHQLHHQRHRGDPAGLYVAAAEKKGVPRRS